MMTPVQRLLLYEAVVLGFAFAFARWAFPGLLSNAREDGRHVLVAIRRDFLDSSIVYRCACGAIFAVVLRIAHLRQPMRYDEAWTFVHYASQPLSVALSDYSFPNNHVFHSLLV